MGIELAKSDEVVSEKAEQSEFAILSDPQQRDLLCGKTDALVRQVAFKDIRNLVFLDKSSRPISTLFLDLWHKHEQQEKDLPPPPKINFLNVGKETSSALEKRLGEEYMAPAYIGDAEYQKWLDALPADKITEAVGQENIAEIQEKYKYLKEMPKGTVLLVEEYTNTGESMLLAEKILKIAFPQLNFTTYSLSNQDDKGRGGRLGLFEKLRDPNDKNGGTYYNPPWRFGSSDAKYGITGVVDSPDSLIARPTRAFSKEARIERNVAEVNEAKRSFDEKLPEALKKVLVELQNDLTDLRKIKKPDFSITSDKMRAEKDKIDMLLSQEKVSEYLNEKIFVPVGILEKTVPQIALYVSEERYEDARVLVERLDEELRTLDTRAINPDTVIQDMQESGKLSSTETKQAYYIKDFLKRFYAANFPMRLPSAYLGGVSREWLSGLAHQRSEANEAIKDTDYTKLVGQLRAELHQAADEYWKRKTES